MHPAQLEATSFGARAHTGSAGIWHHVWFSCLIVLSLAIVVRALHLDVPAYTDEFYTTLAARGWLEHGAPTIGDGLYERAWLYSVMVAWFLDAFGDGVVVARLPSLIAGSLLVVAVFLWTRSVAGALAAWIAALFVCLDPLELLISQFARFYALLSLVFWLGAIGVYALVENRPRALRALIIALASAACFALALHLQVLTLIGLCGLGAWAAWVLGLRWWRAGQANPRRLRRELGLALAVVVVLAAAAVASGLAADLLTRYRSAPLWNAEHRNVVWFYHVLLLERYQVLWPLFPFLTILAVARRPRPALFCFAVFLIGLVFLSFGGMKDRRYIAFIMPFLFVLWGIALAEAWPFLRRCLATTTHGALYRLTPAFATRSGRTVLLALSVLFLVAANGAPARTLFKLAGLNVVAEGGSAEIREARRIADWAAVREPLSAWWNTSDVILTSHDVQTLYFLGDYDIVINNNRMSEIGGGPEFDRDPRTGRPVVSEPASLELILECYGDGLVVAVASQWRTDEAIDAAVAEVIEAAATPLPLPEGAGIVAYYWQGTAQRPRPEACGALPPPRQDRLAGPRDDA